MVNLILLTERPTISSLPIVIFVQDYDPVHMSSQIITISGSTPAIRCRQIGETDVPAVARLLSRGFPNRSRRFWLRALARLAEYQSPRDLPKYGYLLETNGEAVGAILLIFSTIESGEQTTTRCNLSSWYVDPAFRAYATLLVSHALWHKDVTYLNVSAAPHTWPIIEAQGFVRYCDGIFIAAPLLQTLFKRQNFFKNDGVKIIDSRQQPTAAFQAADQLILSRHAAHGCISLWCETEGRAYPFVFRPRLVKNLLPCAQLIYCGDIADFVRFAGPIGRYLARRGRPFVILDSNGAIPGLLGVFCRGSMTKYFKGPQLPRLGDLAYTEYAVLGI
jgi:hypothetical protein